MKKLLLSLLALAATAYTYAETSDCTPNATNTGNSSSTYVTTETEYTADSFTYKVNNWNPKTGQLRGNQSTITKNFYLFNTTAISNIDKIEITVSGTVTATNITFTTGTDASNLTNTGSVSFANSVLTFTPKVATDSFFKIQFKNKSTSGTVTCSKVEITYTPINSDLTPAGLDFTESEYTFTMGEDFVSPTLANPNNLPVSFTSSNEEVATVDENGQLTLVGQGETVITATSEATENYAAGNASYTLHVVDPNAPQTIYSSAIGKDFSFENISLQDGLSNVWSVDETHGYLKGSAFANNKANAAEAIAVSPEIDLTNSNSISLNFQNAFNQYKKNNIMIDVAEFSGYAYIVVKEAGAADWTELCVPTAPTTFSWNFYDNAPIDLSAYSGKKIQIGFKYVSTAEVAGSWEIKNIEITGKPGAVIPSTKPAGIKFAQAAFSVMEDEEFTAPELINPNNLTVTYASTNEDVAIADENSGEIVIGAPGTTVITATFAGNDEFAAGTASYTLTVTPKPVLGEITINGEVADKGEYSFVEGSQITFASENADEILVQISDENDNVVVNEDITTAGTYTWTATTTGLHIVEITTSGCNNDVKNVEFFVTITEKPVDTSIVADFIFKGSDANVSSMVADGVTLEASNSSNNDGVNDMIGKPLTSENGFKLEVTVNNNDATHSKYWSATKGTELRFYANNTLTITAPEGYQLTEITFTAGVGSEWALTTTEGTMSADSKSWTASEDVTYQSVKFTGKSYIGAISAKAIKSQDVPVAPEVPVVTINGEVVTDFDQVIDLQEKSVVVTLTAPEGHHIYHKHVAESAPAPAAVRAAEEVNDFTLVENNVAEVTVENNGTLHFYAHHVASGLQSPVQTLAFTGATTSLTEIEGAQSVASEWYDLQGRRVARPAKGGVYIRKQGSAISKLAF